MWPGLDPQIIRDLAVVKTLVALSRQTPTREWPLYFDAAQNALLVVREWPGGEITTFLASETRQR